MYPCSYIFKNRLLARHPSPTPQPLDDATRKRVHVCACSSWLARHTCLSMYLHNFALPPNPGSSTPSYLIETRRCRRRGRSQSMPVHMYICSCHIRYALTERLESSCGRHSRLRTAGDGRIFIDLFFP